MGFHSSFCCLHMYETVLNDVRSQIAFSNSEKAKAVCNGKRVGRLIIVFWRREKPCLARVSSGGALRCATLRSVLLLNDLFSEGVCERRQTAFGYDSRRDKMADDVND